MVAQGTKRGKGDFLKPRRPPTDGSRRRQTSFSREGRRVNAAWAAHRKTLAESRPESRMRDAGPGAPLGFSYKAFRRLFTLFRQRTLLDVPGHRRDRREAGVGRLQGLGLFHGALQALAAGRIVED